MRLEHIMEDNESSVIEPVNNRAMLSAEVLPILQSKIQPLNRRAAKLKLPPIEIKIHGETWKEIQSPVGGAPYKQKIVDVEVIGQTPKLADWTFVATIEHKEGGNIIRIVPDEENNQEIKRFFDAQPHYCDWCKKKRRRIDTFIVRNTTTNELKQVGRNCLKDFLGGKEPGAILWYLSVVGTLSSVLSDAAGEYERSGRMEYSHEPVNVLALASLIVDNYGFVKTSEREIKGLTTADFVRHIMFHPRPPREPEIFSKTRDQIHAEFSQRKQEAEKIVQWFNTSITPQEKASNNFFHTLDVLLKSKISERDVGYLVAIVPMYKKAQEDKLAQKTPSQWVGAVGQKIAPTSVKVTGEQTIDGPYGRTQIVRMQDANGNMYTWFNNSAGKYQQGEEMTIVGTIKKHDEFRGTKVTVLTRVKQK